ncbi:MAG: hypothetical protein ABI243_12315 [Lapillicoccus sp.]
MGFLDRFRQKKDDALPEDGSAPEPPVGGGDVPSPSAESPLDLAEADEPSTREDQLEWLEESAREVTAPAFDSRADAEESLVEQYVLDDAYDLTEDDVRTVLRRVWQERLDEQASWTDEGDYARVRAAFEALEAEGIVARMNFTCCQNCGHTEIGDERADDSRGYVFFHQQDAERLAPGESDLYLAFGGFRYAEGVDAALVQRAQAGDTEAKQEAIVRSEELVGAEVTAALRAQGLTVEWDGTCAQRIQVTGLDWRKRLPVD